MLGGYTVYVPFWLQEVSVHEKPAVLTTEPQDRKMRKEFDGIEEKGRAPKHLDGKVVFELVKTSRLFSGRRCQRVRRLLRRGRRLLRVMIRERNWVVTRKMKLGSRRFQFSLSTCPTRRT